MSFQIGSVTLPRYPMRIEHKMDADIKSTRFPSALPLLISFGRKAEVLKIEGLLAEAAHTKANLVTDYLSGSGKLEDLIHTVVTITSTGMLYSGRDFVFAGMNIEERPGFARVFFYNMEFWRGSTHVVI